MKFRLFALILIISIFIIFVIFALLFIPKISLFKKTEKLDLPKLILRQDLSLGENEEDENYLFSRIRIDVDDEERIYVLDEKFRNIRVFDKNGRFIQYIGEIGQGPGEYQYPVTFIQVTSKKELVIYDRGVRKFIFYSLNGKFLKEIPLGIMGIPFRIRIDSKGNFVCFYSGAPPSLELKKFSPDFRVLNTLFSQQTEIESGYDLKVGEPTIHFALTYDDNIIWGYSERYKLNVINPEGHLIRKITKNQKPVKFTKKDKDRYKNMYETLIARGAILKFPSHFPAFGDISVDENNRIFVMTYETNKDGDYYYDVFNFQGEIITRITLSFYPLIWKSNKVYTVIRDEKGYSIIKRYIVEWE